MHSTMASESRTRQKVVGLARSGGDVVEQKIRFPAGDRSHELQARLSAERRRWTGQFQTWDMGHGVRDGDFEPGPWLGGLTECWKNWVLAAFGGTCKVAVPAAGVPCGWLAQLPQRTWVPQGLPLLAVRLPVDAASIRYCDRFHIPRRACWLRHLEPTWTVIQIHSCRNCRFSTRLLYIKLLLLLSTLATAGCPERNRHTYRVLLPLVQPGLGSCRQTVEPRCAVTSSAAERVAWVVVLFLLFSQDLQQQHFVKRGLLFCWVS